MSRTPVLSFMVCVVLVMSSTPCFSVVKRVEDSSQIKRKTYSQMMSTEQVVEALKSSPSSRKTFIQLPEYLGELTPERVAKLLQVTEFLLREHRRFNSDNVADALDFVSSCEKFSKEQRVRAQLLLGLLGRKQE